MTEIPQFTKSWLIAFYKEQLDKFTKIGIGKVTEFDIKVTQQLIDITRKRLIEISGLKAFDLKVSSYKVPTKQPASEEQRLKNVQRVREFRKRQRLKALENKIHENGQILATDFKSVNGKVRKIRSTRRHGKDES